MSKRVLLWNTLSSYLRVFVCLLISFWIIPTIISGVGQEGFGLWSLLFSVLAIVTLLEMGLGTTTVKYVADFHGKQDISSRNRVFTLFFLVYLGLTALCFGVITLLSLWLNELFAIPESQEHSAHLLLWILGARVILSQLLFNLFRGLLFGEQKIALINCIVIVTQLLYGFFVWAVVSAKGGLVDLAWMNFMVMLIEHAFYVFAAFFMIKGLRFELKGLSWQECRKYAKFSGYQLLTNLAILLLLQMDLVIINGFLTLEAVAIYAIGLKLASHLRTLVKQFVNVLSPYLARLKGEGNLEQIRKVLVTCTQLALVPGVVIGVGLLCVGEPFIELWIGSGFEEAYQIMVVLVVAVIVSVPPMVSANVMAMTGAPNVPAFTSVAAVSLNLVLSIVLVYWFGALGVAVATLISAMVTEFFYMGYRACQMYRVSYMRYLLQGCLLPCLPGVIQGGVLLMTASYFALDSIPKILIACCLSSLVYVFLYWRWCVEHQARTMIYNNLFSRT